MPRRLRPDKDPFSCDASALSAALRFVNCRGPELRPGLVMSSMGKFEDWVRALEARHLADLTFPEVSRALRALSSAYVERRGRLAEGGALSGAGKRAAFALFYGPLHWLLINEIVRQLDASSGRSTTLVDLGCGTGAAGAAWGGAFAAAPEVVVGIDRHPWVLAEAARTYRDFGLTGRIQQGDVAKTRWPPRPTAFVAAFTLNELADGPREEVLARLIDRGRGGDPVLLVEPLAGFVAPWWTKCRASFEAAGGHANEWRFQAELPEIVAKLDRAAGLDHRELTGRSLWLGR